MNEDRKDACNLESLKDKGIMDSTTGNVDVKFQKTLIYNKLLPYVDELEAESETLLAEIKANLGQAVMLREIEVGCIHAASRLCA